MKYVQTIKITERRPFSSFSIVDYEQVNVCWVILTNEEFKQMKKIIGEK